MRGEACEEIQKSYSRDTAVGNLSHRRCLSRRDRPVCVKAVSGGSCGGNLVGTGVLAGARGDSGPVGGGPGWTTAGREGEGEMGSQMDPSFPHIVNELRVVQSKGRKRWALGLGCLLFSFYLSTGQGLRFPHHRAEPWVLFDQLRRVGAWAPAWTP